MNVLKVVFLVLVLTGSFSYAEDYSTPLLKADWSYERGPSYCQLTQKISLYGMAEFMHQSGELLRFSIRENRNKPEIVRASLVIDSAPWIHQSVPKKEHLVYLDLNIDIQNYPRLSVYGDSAESMLDALSQGLFPTFSYIRASVTGMLPETRVAVSSVNFLKQYQQFSDCRIDFLPSGLKTVLEKIYYFKSASKSLSASAQKQLGDTVKYLKEVRGSRILIVSKTAIAGNRDKKWFLSRANVISANLIKQGITKNKITIKSGPTIPSTDNKVITVNIFGPDSLNTIYYRKGNTKLTRLEKQRLDVVAHYANEFMPHSQLIIKSYTDSKGKRATNLNVSQQRGDVIKRYLISQGLSEKRVQVKAYGESRPVKSNRFPRGRAQNRRAIIEFLG